MNKSVFFDKKIAKRIDQSVCSENGSSIGFLLGYSDETSVNIVGAAACISQNKLVGSHHRISLHLPAGLSYVGIYLKSSQTNCRVIMEKLCELVIPAEMKDVFDTNCFIVYTAEIDTASKSTIYWYDMTEKVAKQAEATPYDSQPLDKSLLFRLKASTSVRYQLVENLDRVRENIVVEMYALRARLLAPKTMYRVDDTEILVTADSKNHPSSVKELLDTANLFDKFAKKKNTNRYSDMVVNVRLYENISEDPPINCAPVIHHKHELLNEVDIPINLDVVCYVHENEPASLWPKRLQCALDNQLEAFTNCLLKYNTTKNKKTLAPQAYHFFPTPLNHFISVIYPDGITDDKLVDTRQSIQQTFLLPLSRPYVRASNAYLFPGESSSQTYLCNVHEGLAPSGVPGGLEYIVQGRYSYHHYMQDHINDDGWGCAYRSLQTLVSWFRHQGYTDKPVPSHNQIQQVLVDIGDKPNKFVGSKQWIGSMEVSFVFNTLLEIDCKTLYVSSGAELGSKGRELAQHFETQGTPIMIGGGVLAHTILGVSFNENSGEVKFLILDPHYTGGEDLRTIQDKGWCGWKTTEFWDQNAYYNLCMPQLPVLI